MVDFVGYFRVSTDKQGITGLGMDAQRESVSRYVQNRGQIIAEFIEVESCRKVNRPQLRAALEECRKRRAVLLIARLDRLARNVAFIANLMNSDKSSLGGGEGTWKEARQSQLSRGAHQGARGVGL
jgi:DNA invertase Pin-like site-specific DNA recombinase